MRQAACCTSTPCRRPGRIACDIDGLGADLLTLSAHKIGGPQGRRRACQARRDVHVADPLIKGGGQERGARAGTENVAGIAGFGAAAAAALAELAADAARMAALRDRLEAGLRASTPQAVIFGAGVERLPNTTLFALPGMKAETAIIAFDLEGIARIVRLRLLLRQGAALACACGHGRVDPSWRAARCASASAGRTTEADIERLLNAWNKVSSMHYLRRATRHRRLKATELSTRERARRR